MTHVELKRLIEAKHELISIAGELYTKGNMRLYHILMKEASRLDDAIVNLQKQNK